LKLDIINDELLGTVYEHKKEKGRRGKSNMFISLKNKIQTLIAIIISWLI
jgi:hypothetical protein